MPGHPLDDILVDGVSVDKGAFRTELKNYIRNFGTAAEFRPFNLPGIKNAVIDNAVWYFDPLDLVSADNGTTVIVEAGGRRFKKVVLSVAGETIFRQTAIAGTANAPVITTNGLATLTATPQFVMVTFASDNSTAMTIQFDAQSAVALKSPSGAALAAGEAMGGRPYLLSVTSSEARIYMSGVTW